MRSNWIMGDEELDCGRGGAGLWVMSSWTVGDE